jgi:hypothetical protein
VLGLLKRAYLKWKFGPSIIVVSGLPRSGTSMMMKMLEAGGMELATDNIRTADEDNPKGYFEYERVKQLDKSEDKSWLGHCRGKAIKIISFLLRELPADFHYKVIFMQRHLEEVIASQNKMLVRRGEPTNEANDNKMIKNYGMHLKKMEFLLEDEPNFSTLEVGYREVLERPAEHAARIRRFVGIDLDTEGMAGAVDRKLYRNRRES